MTEMELPPLMIDPPTQPWTNFVPRGPLPFLSDPSNPAREREGVTMQVNVSFEMSVDEEQFDSTHDWCASRIEDAIEETMRAAIGFAVPFARRGIAVSVGNFKFERATPSKRSGKETR